MLLNKSLNMIGLCMKAGMLKSGELPVEMAIKEGKVHLVIVAEDASDNTKKKFTNMCTFREIPLVMMFTKEEIGKAIGKEIRATIGIVDENFARSIEKTWR
ncbi:MAG: ribosomal L7Ae/L30e/S12e/Gadd45 family protein [Vallitaleaceae bacterium]|nr:ribosomal L7Ae/L30e/S12e/Gadd45 family protein [Vallitaleaceae bacterium]